MGTWVPVSQWDSMAASLAGCISAHDLRVMVALKAEQQDEDQGEGRGDAHANA